MSAASFTAGFLILVISTILRFLVNKNVNSPTNIIKLFSIPGKDIPDDIYTALGHLMGMLWCAIGYFLAITEKWFSSSIIGIILVPCILFIPFLIGTLTLRLLISRQKK
ncbi:MAG TPA: hypothetical protein VGK00_03860 [Anaerolineales bacterium]|jgi:hypothetical protein